MRARLSWLVLLLGCTRSPVHRTDPPRPAPPLPVVPVVVDAGPAAACLPVASCQCFRGACLAVVPSAPHRARVQGGARDGDEVLLNHTCPGDDEWAHLSECLDWVEEMQACTGACVLEDPGYRCAMVAGVCSKQ